MIRVVNVTQHYGVRPILRDLSLEVQGGELLVLMGPNGMAKSTLLSVMAGLLTPQRGYVEIEGKVRRSSVEAEREIRRRVVYLPDQAWLPLLQTGREFLMSVGQLYAVEDLRLMDHVDRLLDLFQMKEHADTPIRSYSSGQRKKIALSGALVTEAPIMLLDEPFSGGLDPSAILALKQVLKRMAERTDVTIALATPVPELVEELAERVAVMRAGQIIACDTIDNLRRIAGTSGPLSEVYERLTSPQTLDRIERYFHRPMP